MNFKNKEKPIINRIKKSFLVFTLLTASLMPLKAESNGDNFKVHFPSPSKVKVEKLNIDKSEEEITRYYAHKGVYIVNKDGILFKNFDFKVFGFKHNFEINSKIIDTYFLNVKKDHFNDYAAIFVLFKNCKLEYYVFKNNSKDVVINRLKLPKFEVSEDTKIEITNVDLKKGRYNIKISSPQFEDKNYSAEIILEAGEDE